MFLEFFKKEVFTSLKRPMIYIFMGIVGLLVFGGVVSDNVQIGGIVGDVKKNAPYIVARYVVILNIFGLLFAAAFFNNAALRDHKFGFNEIMFSTPISKAGYYFGRFCGAWVLSTLVMVGIYLGFLIGSIVGPALNWIGPERIGPTPWKAFFSTFFIFVVPNMFLAGAIIFALATRFKSTVISFVGAMVVLIGYTISLSLMSDMDNESLAALIDVFGISPYILETQYYTPLEKNTLNPSLTGHVLTNRLLWTSVGAGLLFFGYYIFSFATKAKKVSKKKTDIANNVTQIFEQPHLSNFGVASNWTQFVSFFKINFLSIVKSTVFIILLIFAVLMLVSNLYGGFEYFGLQSYPVTYKMLDEINGISTLFVVIVLVFFSGELVWRDRDNHIHEVIDGTPHSSVISLFAKTLSLALVGSILHLFLMGIGMLYQLANGYTNLELGVYFTDFITGGFLIYLIWGGFLVFIQVLINNKYIGYFVAVLFIFIIDLIFLALKMESKMLMIGMTPSTRYSDMNGFGPGMKGHLWFSAYWILFALLTVIIAGLVWPRGMNKTIKDRFANSQKSLGKTYYGTLGFCSVAWIVLAGFVYYNTQILNPYKTSTQDELQQVEYERKLKKYENIASPSITDAVFNIDIFPSKRGADMQVDLVLKNKTTYPIDTLCFTNNENMNQTVEIANSELIVSELDGLFVVYKLNQALMPGDSMNITVGASYHAKGFENSVSSTEVVKNGTFFNNDMIMPILGYSSRYEISDKNKRRKYDLPEKERMPELETECSHTCMKNYLTSGSADWVNVETYISTSADQIAIAPGSKVSEKIEDGRKKYHYQLDHPSQFFFSFISADYEVATRKWNGIDLEVYYHAAHEINVERMLNAMQESLEYYTRNFGPYFHKQARIIEFPRYAGFAQAFPGTMPYSESLGFIVNLEDEGEHKNDVIKAVVAHEIAHQYWAHQVIGAEMQGSTMLSESFAEYSSLMVLKEKTSPIDMKDFLKYDHRRYLRGRSRETDKELPLHKVENQMHIHYGKGSVILYGLQEYIGEDKVNAALKGFLEEYRYQEPPYPTSNDFMRYLDVQVPDSLQYLIKDWFEEITLYDLRVDEASYSKNAIGKYDVKVDLIAKKTKAEPTGEVKDVSIGDWVDIGFFKDRGEKELMFSERVYLDKENVSLNFTLDTIPAKAAIDPLRILIDRVYDDNVKTVSVKE